MISHGRGDQGALCHKEINPIQKEAPNHLPEALPPNTITLEVKTSLQAFEGRAPMFRP